MVGDANDNPPEFQQQNSASSPLVVKVPMGLPPGTELIKLAAKDMDREEQNSRIHYTLRTSEELRDKLKIDPRTGAITLNAEIDTNQKDGAVFGGDVDATDEGEPPLTSSLSIQFRTSSDLNPHSPEFDKFRYEVAIETLNETIPDGTLIAQVHAKDRDTGEDGRVEYGKVREGNSWLSNFTVDREVIRALLARL